MLSLQRQFRINMAVKIKVGRLRTCYPSITTNYLRHTNHHQDKYRSHELNVGHFIQF